MTLTAPETTSTTYTQLAGIAVPYRETADLGAFTEEFTPGALALSIHRAPRPIPLLLWHDRTSFPIGKLTDWDDTRDGLHTTFTLDRSDVAQDAGRLAADEFFAFLSIGFAPINVDWTHHNDRDHARIIEARLLEVSLVATPAYAGAHVQHVTTGTSTRAHHAPKSHTRPLSTPPAPRRDRQPLPLALLA